MTDVRLPSSGNIKLRWHTALAFADPSKPTPTEVNNGLPLETAVSWNDFDFGIQASNTNSDPALSSKSNTTDRGAMQYGGSLSLYLPAVLGSGDEYDLAHDALKNSRVTGWLTMQVDGELSETSTPTYTGGLTKTAAVGDLIHVFKVMTAGYSNAMTGEEAFRETVSFLPQGEAHINAVIQTVAAVTVAPSTLSVAVAAHDKVTAKVGARDYTNGVRWSSSDPGVATVSQTGVVTGVATGTATITGKYAGATGTCTVTVP